MGDHYKRRTGKKTVIYPNILSFIAPVSDGPEFPAHLNLNTEIKLVMTVLDRKV